MNKFQLMILANTSSTETYVFLRQMKKKPRGKNSYNKCCCFYKWLYCFKCTIHYYFWAWLPTANDEIKIYWKQNPGCMCDSFKCVCCKCRRRVMFILNYPLLNPLSSISQEMYHFCVKISQGKLESWEIFISMKVVCDIE